MSFIQNFFTSRDNNANTETYLGQKDRLWYNPDTNSIRISDGVTPGGLVVDLETNANASFNTITANTGTINGNLIVVGNISPAANNKVGGIKPGPGVDISLDGLLTIDTANLPLSFGDFTASNNVLSIVNLDEDMILSTGGNAEIQLVGDIGFYKPDGLPPNIANRYFSATGDGQIQILVSNVDPLSAAVNIIGTTAGGFSAPVNTGVMLQLTGQANIPSRFYNDGVGGFAAFVGRRVNGTPTAPTPILAGDEIIRISSTGYNGTEIAPGGSARIVFQAMENYTPANSGSNLSFWTAAIGSNTLAKIVTIDNANGLVATKVVATGNVTGGNLVTAGSANITGNVNAGNLVLPTGDIIYTPRHGSFYSNVDQTNPVANTARSMTFNNTVTANGVSVVSNSRLTIAKPGVYNIQFSAQVAKTGGGTGYVDIWLNQNGNPVDWSTGTIPVVSSNPVIASWNYVENVTVANTYYEIMWSSVDINTLLDATVANTNPTRPGIPSVIVTVTPVGA